MALERKQLLFLKASSYTRISLKGITYKELKSCLLHLTSIKLNHIFLGSMAEKGIKSLKYQQHVKNQFLVSTLYWCFMRIKVRSTKEDSQAILNVHFPDGKRMLVKSIQFRMTNLFQQWQIFSLVLFLAFSSFCLSQVSLRSH